MRFTVVTPSFNQLDWLRRCVASVRDQVSTPLSVEHIVQDAGTEGIEKFAREHGAVLYREGEKDCRGQEAGGEGEQTGDYSLTIYSERDAGMYDAINRGLRKATGEICAYLNCDEQYLPQTLRWVADFFSDSPGTDVLFGAAIVVREDGSYVCDRRVMVPTRWHSMVSGNLSIFTGSTFFRRSAVLDRGLFFDPHWKVVGDAVWTLRLIEAGLVMTASHRPLSAFAETGGNLSGGGNPRAAEETRRLRWSAPAVARCLRPCILLSYRLRRWLTGAYKLHPHSYAIYTDSECRQRRQFDVRRPCFRWQLGAS